MKVIRITSTAILSLLLGISAPSYGQQEQQRGQQGHSEQQQSRHEQAKPGQQQKAQRQEQPNQGKQQQHARQQEQNRQQQQHVQQQEQNRQQQQHAKQQEQNRQQQQHVQQQDQNRQQQQRQQQRQGSQGVLRGQPVQRGQEREVWQQHRASNWQSEHRDWRQRGGYNGYRIPDDRFRGNFGENHWFRIHSYPMELYGGYPRFRYGGYWFGFMDPWPEYWAGDWYDNDDVYIVFSDGGYYLYNRRYPRDRIAVTVYLR